MDYDKPEKPNHIYSLKGRYLARNGIEVMFLQGVQRDQIENEALRNHIVKLLNQAAGT